MSKSNLNHENDDQIALNNDNITTNHVVPQNNELQDDLTVNTSSDSTSLLKEEAVPQEAIKKIKVRSSKQVELEKEIIKASEEIQPTKKSRQKAKAKEVEYKPKVKEEEPEEIDENYTPGSRKKWYVLKIQVNREEAIRDSLKRRAAIAGLEVYLGDILIPTEKVTEVRNGKKKIVKVVKKKLYPGYLMINMEITQDTLFLVRDTPGVGDFTGASGRPTPMLEHEIMPILNQETDVTEEKPKLRIGFNIGDKIKIKDGTFENFEGEVHQIDTNNGRVTVMINIFGRSTPVELEYWQIETPEK